MAGNEWPPLIGMTFEETLKALRIEEFALRKAIREEGFPARRIGRGWRIDPDAVKAWLAEGRWDGKRTWKGRRKAAKAAPPPEEAPAPPNDEDPFIFGRSLRNED